ncbi:unnamed protein product [Ophioblennius macclurei]
MLEFVGVAVAVFSLLSVGQTAPVSDCESLIKPVEIQSRDQLLGKWIHIADSAEPSGANDLAKMLVESVWWNITIAEENDKLEYFTNQKMLGLCFSLKMNATLSNNILTMVQPYDSAAFRLSTKCPDCVVFYSNNTFGDTTFKSVQILSRRSVLSAPELEEFKKQVECLNLPPPSVLDPEKGFCADPSVSQDKSYIDLTSSVGSTDLTQVETILKSKNGMQLLMKMVMAALIQRGQN